jgi:pyrroloquinoline quinone biosynthesis protein B
VAGPSPALARALAEADVLFFDGTFWSSDELIALGLGTRRAEEMSHWPLGGPQGSAAFLARQPGRRILIHINNTNPILREGSPERRALDAAGIEVATDGLELSL